MTRTVKTICPYCGVGCGVEVTLTQDGSVNVIGDKSHPANYGRLCSKGAALGETLALDDRLLYPEVNGKEASWQQALDTVAQGFAKAIEEHGADSVAFYVSGQLLTEDYYVANKLMKGYIGSANIDTNSRLCMSSTVVGHKRAFGSDTVPCSYEDLEKANLVILVGSNAAWCHPVLYQRLAQAKKDNPQMSVVVIDPRKTATCDIADLHLPLRPGTDVLLFNGLLSYLENSGERNDLFVSYFTEGLDVALETANQSAGDITQVAKQCELPESLLLEFFSLYAKTERVVTVYSQGVNQSSSGSDKVNAIINCHLFTGRIGRPGMGPFSFTGQTNAMGGREVGGLANQLAAHMDIENEEHRNTVQSFWSSPVIAEQAGLKAMDMFKAVEEGRIKALWIMCTNPVVSVANADLVKRALEKCDFVVVSDCIKETDTTHYADVLLPASTWGEKSGTVTNSERRISRSRPFLDAPGEAKADWWIICEVAKRMGFEDAFDYATPLDVFKEHAQLSGYENNGSRDFDISALKAINADDYESFNPIQWPLTSTSPLGKKNMFVDGKFFTNSNKARFVALTPRQPVNQTNTEFPFILNTGRSRDQWHTMTRTGKTARLTEHAPESYAELHPEDAAKIGTSNDALVSIRSQWGEVIVRVRVTQDQRKGSVFVPMHWNDRFASKGRIDAVVNPATDPFSGQPEFKHTPVEIKPYHPKWHGFLLSKRNIALSGTSYWAKATGNGFARFELAGEQSPDDWPTWARSMLCANDDDVNWVELLDASAGRYRGVRMVGNTVESCIFIAPSHELPSRSWLGGLFSKDTIDDSERVSLLAGKPLSSGEDTGKTICACFGVGLNTIVEAIKTQKLTSTDEIGKVLKAGTNCGSCVPELRTILATQAN